MDPLILYYLLDTNRQFNTTNKRERLKQTGAHVGVNQVRPVQYRKTIPLSNSITSPARVRRSFFNGKSIRKSIPRTILTPKPSPNKPLSFSLNSLNLIFNFFQRLSLDISQNTVCLAPVRQSCCLQETAHMPQPRAEARDVKQELRSRSWGYDSSGNNPK